jgi:fucose permease
MNAHTQAAAIVLLFAFAFAMAGMNPTAVACAGRMTSVTSIGILLPVGSLGAVVMPWCIGMAAQLADLQAGMMLNLAPCLGMILFAIAVRRLPQEETA